MSNNRADILIEVETFLTRRRAGYESFLEDIVRDLVRFRDSNSSDAIYRIYTRADKQIGGSKLKSVDSIIKKITRWRKEDKKTHISKIHDIIGATIVTYFSSDVPKIVNEFERNKFSNFEFVSKETKSSQGYYAEHVIVRRRPRKQSLADEPMCEIQIKTLLHDGWATKTHDLTYKTIIKINPEIHRQISLLGRSIQTLEEQSDSLRSVILRSTKLDEERRDSAATHLAYELTQVESPNLDIEIRSLSLRLKEYRDHLRMCEDDDTVLAELIEEWRRLQRTLGDNRHLCRCIILLAALRGSSDLDGDALEAVEAWISSSTDGAAKAGALSFKALSHWMIGEFDDAVGAGERALVYAEQHGLPTSVSKLNLAYYLAERFFATTVEDESAQRAAIFALLDGVEDATVVRQRLAQIDSIGAIRIMIASTRDEVYEGRALCREAKQMANESNVDAELFNQFYDLHERRAAQKLAELE